MKRKILIVEDDETLLELLKSYICEHRRQEDCQSASTLSDALDKVKNNHFDIILLDILLKEGFSTPIIKCAKDSWPDKQTEIILVSAMSGAQKFAEQNNVHKLVIKPFSLDTIDEIVPKYG